MNRLILWAMLAFLPLTTFGAHKAHHQKHEGHTKVVCHDGTCTPSTGTCCEEDSCCEGEGCCEEGTCCDEDCGCCADEGCCEQGCADCDCCDGDCDCCEGGCDGGDGKKPR